MLDPDANRPDPVFNAEKCNLVALKCILGGFFSFYAPDLL